VRTFSHTIESSEPSAEAFPHFQVFVFEALTIFHTVEMLFWHKYLGWQTLPDFSGINIRFTT